jgi:uncharacterized protein (DUF2062 family)
MPVWIHNWLAVVTPFGGTVAALVLGFVVYVFWKQFQTRAWRRFYRQRARERRAYWGWE